MYYTKGLTLLSAAKNMSPGSVFVCSGMEENSQWDSEDLIVMIHVGTNGIGTRKEILHGHRHQSEKQNLKSLDCYLSHMQIGI
eukprot:g39365.t1